MEQAELRRWEARCTQEEPPRCRAACPLHVDVKEFCTRMAEEKYDQAWATLCRTMPLPRVLARICDGPCRSACIRGQAGGSIELPALEHVCAQRATRQPRILPAPSRGKKAAVLGCDLAGLAAAWDMTRKGIAVTIYTDTPPADALDGLHIPPAAADSIDSMLQQELDTLRRLGAEIQEHTEITSGLAAGCLEECGAVFITPRAYDRLMAGLPEPDPLTLGTATHGVFAAPPLPCSVTEGASPVAAAAQGSRAATSVARLHEGASLVAGREREGVFESTLFTSLEKVQPAPPVPVPAGGYDATQARNEAARCLRCECMECVRHCVFLQEYGSYPKQYARRIYNNESIVMGTRQANTMINSCMQCGLCATLCPNGFDMGALCAEARQSMVRRGKMPPSAHDFALRDMEFANGEHCTLARHAPDTQASGWVFFPGCQLAASDPDSIPRTWEWLRRHLPPSCGTAQNQGVGLMLRCCGAPAQWSGRNELTAGTVAALKQDWENLGSPVIIAACPSCAVMLRSHLPQADVTGLWEIMDSLTDSRPDILQPATADGHPAVVLHDPCGTREDAPMRQAVRSLLERYGIAVHEPELTAETTECCGFGGLAAEANATLGKKITEGRALRLGAPPAQGKTAEAAPSGTDLQADAVTYCAMCRDRLAAHGKRTAHLLDILLPAQADAPAIAAAPLPSAQEEPVTGTLPADCCAQGFSAAARHAPSLSARHENRARLREYLLTSCWDEAPAASGPQAALGIRYTAQAAARMEERRILDADVRKVLLHSRDNRWLQDTRSPQGHRLASLRPVVVTYWVEFTRHDENTFTVHNVWSHRMHVRTVNGRTPS
jgi:hypothetical protein